MENKLPLPGHDPAIPNAELPETAEYYHATLNDSPELINRAHYVGTPAQRLVLEMADAKESVRHSRQKALSRLTGNAPNY